MVHHPDIALMDGHMTLAYACVLIAALLPYVWTMVAKAGGKKFDNRDPRQWLEKQENPRVRRADAAQKNAFEAFPAFAASVLMAQLAGIDAQRIGWLAAACLSTVVSVTKRRASSTNALAAAMPGVTLANLTRSHSANSVTSVWALAGAKGAVRSAVVISSVVRSRAGMANWRSR